MEMLTGLASLAKDMTASLNTAAKKKGGGVMGWQKYIPGNERPPVSNGLQRAARRDARRRS